MRRDAPELASNITTLVHLLQHQAAVYAEKTVFVLLENGEADGASLSFRQLNQDAKRFAVRLRQHASPKERVLLLYPPGLTYIVAFFGTLYAGCVPVPLYPPRHNRYLYRVLAVATDAQTSLALADSKIIAKIRSQFDTVEGLRQLRLFDFNTDINQISPSEWHEPQIDADSLALLQYTSGSTAAPKGVMVSHQNLLHNSAIIQHFVQSTPADDTVSWLPPYHDMGLIGGILQPVYCGGRAFLMAPVDFASKPIRWLQAISRYQTRVASAPNFAFDFCVDKTTPEQRASLDLSYWEMATVGAEPVRAATMERFIRTFEPHGLRKTVFHPVYGLAEATLFVSGNNHSAPPKIAHVQRSALTAGKVVMVKAGSAAEQQLVSCGYSAPGQEIAIVNPKTSTRCAPNQVGEIWVSGLSVAQGYWQKSELSAETFSAQLADFPDKTFLRTGDLGFLHDGELFIAGRLKDLIIIQGRNHYPQDIELTTEQAHPALQPGGSAAFSVEVDGQGEKLVVVQEVRRTALRKVDFDEVIRAIRVAISEVHEIQPYAVVLVKPTVVPKTSSGKVQRFVCRRQFLEGTLKSVATWSRQTQATTEASFIPHRPGSHIEAALVEMWKEVLDVDDVGVSDDFFQWGGDSLSAMQILSRIENVFGVELALSDLFEFTTIEKLARHIETVLHTSTPIEPIVIKPVSRENPLPTAFSQERMWFVQQLQPENSAYNIVIPVRLTGNLNMNALEWALHQVIQRHESLRTIITTIAGVAYQVILPQINLTPKIVDLRHLPENEREAALFNLAEEHAARPFVLDKSPLLRVLLVRWQDDVHFVQITVHHAVFDAWSTSILGREIVQLYESRINGHAPVLPDMTIQYADFAAWQRQWIRGEFLQSQLNYWVKKMKDVPALSLPTDRPRPPEQTYYGTFQSIEPSADVFDAIRRLSRTHNTTPFMVFMAAFQTLLYRYTGQIDFAVGTPIANRHNLAGENIIGTLVNTLVFRADLSGKPTFSQLLQTVRQTALEAYAHQDLPFEKLVLETKPDRKLSYAPLFQVMLDYINVPVPNQTFAGLTWELMDVDRHGAQFDMTLAVLDTKETRRISVEYNTDLFDATTITRFLEHYQILLTSIVKNPDTPISQLPILSPQEKHTLLTVLNDTQVAYPKNTLVHQLFEIQAAKNPEKVAVIFQGQSLTYGALNARATQLAKYLQRQGVTPGQYVGIALHRSLDMVVAVLGILKAGGAYLPLDPAFPPKRLAYMLEDSRAEIIVTQTDLADWLAEIAPASASEIICIDANWQIYVPPHSKIRMYAVDSRKPAYIIYTSGSTGNPKGVQVSHQNVVNFLHAMQEQPGFTADDHILSVTTLSFDISVLEIFLPLVTGASLEIVSGETTRNGKALVRQLNAANATVMQATPVTWRMMIQAGWQGSPRLKALCGGEALPVDLATQLLPRVDELWNMYGPTETTVWSTVMHIQNASKITIGHPIANTQIYILDEEYQPVPIGVVGELYIGGDGVTIGYLHQEALTAERFLKNPFIPVAEARMYRTGDLARYLPDGNIEFLGRVDHQVKVRGFRVELGEIESILSTHPDVRQVVVFALHSQQLAAYIVTQSGSPLATHDIRHFLQLHLPDYMIPAYFLFVDEFPLTPNGKVDRKKLPVPEHIHLNTEHTFIAPRTPTEKKLVEIWERLLSVEPVGVTDDFFEIGGSSLLALQLFERIEATFHVSLPLSGLFRGATIEYLAALIEESDDSWSPLVPIQPEGDTPPFFCVHGITGDVLWFRELASHLAPDYPFYGIQALGLDGKSPPFSDIEKMAAYYLDEIQKIQPEGPYFLGGASFGGTVALEMSQQLLKQGHQVGLLVIFDHYPPNITSNAKYNVVQQVVAGWRMLSNVPRWVYNFGHLDFTAMVARVRRKINIIIKRYSTREKMQHQRSTGMVNAEDLIDYAASLPEYRKQLIEEHYRAISAYQPQPYAGRVLLFRAKAQSLFNHTDPVFGWRTLAGNGVEVKDIPGSHERIFTAPNVETLAYELKCSLAETSRSTVKF